MLFHIFFAVLDAQVAPIEALPGVGGGGEGGGMLEDSAEFDQARGHHGEVGEHVGAAEEGAEGAHGFGYAAALFDDGLAGAGGFKVPLPGVFEGGDPSGGRVPGPAA